MFQSYAFNYNHCNPGVLYLEYIPFVQPILFVFDPNYLLFP